MPAMRAIATSSGVIRARPAVSQRASPRSGVGLRIRHGRGWQPVDLYREVVQFGVDRVPAHGLAAGLAQGKERCAGLA